MPVLRLARHREQVWQRAVKIDAALFGGCTMTDFEQQAREAEDDFTKHAAHLTTGGMGAVVTALHGNVAEAAGAQALRHAGGREADFVGEVAVTDGGCERALRVESQQPQFTARFECFFGSVQKTDELVFGEVLDDVLSVQEIEGVLL